MWILLGIGSGLSWGVADFFGGLQSRRLPALAVSFWSQIAGGIALLAVVLAGGGAPTGASVGWGIVAGLFGGLGLVLFYRGLAIGTMSIVAPVAACGAIVPVVLSMLRGEPLTLLAGTGIAVALLGIVLVSLAPGGTETPVQHARAALSLALGAALSFGLFFVFLDQGSAVPAASPLWVVGGARVGSLAMLVLLIMAGPRAAPWPGRRMGAVTAIGVLDTTANVLFTYASTKGNLGIVAVLGSLYPVATALLGRVLLSERLTPTQLAGVACALFGVVMLSAA